MRAILVGTALGTVLTGCAWSPVIHPPTEILSGYAYIPVDPFPVTTRPGLNCPSEIAGQPTPYEKLPKGLPDNAVRMLVEEFDTSGHVTYGPVRIGASNKSYRITTDFISVDTVSFRVAIQKRVRTTSNGEWVIVPFEQSVDDARYEKKSESYTVTRILDSSPSLLINSKIFTIPIYIGIGLRATADIVTTNAKANVSGLGVIGSEAEAGNLKGSLIVQTLGVNGKAITAALPIQSELNRTTAQNAIVAVASIKTLLHSDETDIAPRVVGLYLPFSGGKSLVNAVISELSTVPPEWMRPCTLPTVQVLPPVTQT